ncbi:GAF and ANTAR domain-containing protein [Streptomyces sp. MST-110588]|uniref:GAF and ANTAR domain-containing protein n=1 Tax=Streptomyces sp. MST-110588 TaxID=2833628 RepID=UPI001F5D43EB|nr:GAF and ANTAR domain-containing protein [Streptomyces sp. MST-110588]
MSFSGDAFGLAESLTAAAVELHVADGPRATMRTAVNLAVRTVPAAEYAGISAADRNDQIRTLAWTDEIVRTVDQSHDRFPDHLLDRFHESGSTVIERGESDPQLSLVGLRSALSFRLRGTARRTSVLTVYARAPRAFDRHSVRIGRLLSAYVGIALESAMVQEQLTEAMQTRDVIGQATGVLMGKLDINGTEAFGRLVRASQKENVKVRDIALRIVETANGTQGPQPANG